jgi:hypothetical protein
MHRVEHVLPSGDHIVLSGDTYYLVRELTAEQVAKIRQMLACHVVGAPDCEPLPPRQVPRLRLMR